VHVLPLKSGELLFQQQPNNFRQNSANTHKLSKYSIPSKNDGGKCAEKDL